MGVCTNICMICIYIYTHHTHTIYKHAICVYLGLWAARLTAFKALRHPLLLSGGQVTSQHPHKSYELWAFSLLHKLHLGPVAQAL